MKKRHLLLPLALFSATCSAFEFTEPKQNDTSNLVWTGHISPDTDTMTSAMIAAHIYGGTAVVPGPINPESTFVINYCNATAPQVLADFSQRQVALLDFNQKTQLHPTINESDIVAIIDHHAIGGMPVNLSQVASFDIRPWGSTATVLAARAESLNIDLPKQIACTTLAGILSDTVIFDSPTTTQYDRDYAEKLAKQAGISDLNDFGQQMLIAKSDLSAIDAAEILTMDYKVFEYSGKNVGIGVAETLVAEQLLTRKDEFIKAMQAHKKEQQLDHLFFSVTDTKNQQANLLWIDDNDSQVIKLAFKQTDAATWLALPEVTSRKRQIGPAIQSAIAELN
ncbi:manganese-dependent inorganic pyrophosphatase [Psychromonas marina]|uniref:inorganic diphosphatase n=1 Tax=Psychromonas marina TaxID=88364 RepID=A0ABQ6E056_9GAMM|nr:manganese-dependent inorganic pyrophosphatase [Psychromonas marina]GLS90508.1 manganese-dependent inorganic pyrophosphatase [Psychromonas marina]